MHDIAKIITIRLYNRLNNKSIISKLAKILHNELENYSVQVNWFDIILPKSYYLVSGLEYNIMEHNMITITNKLKIACEISFNKFYLLAKEIKKI